MVTKKPLNISYSQTVFKLMLEFKMVSCGLGLYPKISSQMAKGIKLYKTLTPGFAVKA